jgi:hypothetical protein
VSFWTNILERINREWNPWSQHGLAPQRQGYKESSELDPRISAHTRTLSLLRLFHFRLCPILSRLTKKKIVFTVLFCCA